MNKDFEFLFNANSKLVFNISLNIVQNIEDAEDITQDVFIEVYHSLSSFNEKSKISTWIFRIAVNKSLDFLRSKNRKKRSAFITQYFQSNSGTQLFEPSNFNHPGVILENKESSQMLFKAVEKLPEKQKLVFVLRKIEGFPQKEVAEIMDVSEKAVESLMHRSKGNLRNYLEKFYKE